MSHDLAVWDGFLPGSDDEALERYLEDCADGGPRQSSERLLGFVRALTVLHPDRVDDGAVESLVWAVSPLEPTGDFLALTMTHASAEQVSADVVALAVEHNLTVFDPQSGHRLVLERTDPQVPAQVLMGERHRDVHNPSIEEVASRLRGLGRSDPWLVLDRPATPGVYMQVYRTSARHYDIEHRDGGAETHHAARLTDVSSVIAAFHSWYAGDGGWKDIDWLPLELP